MNERFKELALKSGCRARKFTRGVSMYQNVDDDLEKFAELIVRECVNVGINAFHADHSVVPVFPATAIKEHFGIE